MLTIITYNLYFASFQEEFETASNIEPHIKEDNYVYFYYVKDQKLIGSMRERDNVKYLLMFLN